jgi:hypothetical protein
VQDDPGRLEQVRAQQRSAVLRDVAGVVVLARLTPRRQADIGADTRRLRETLRAVADVVELG